MGDYLRTTRECTFDSLNPIHAAAVRAYIAKHELGDVEESVLMCCETTSIKQKKGLFGSKTETNLVAVVLTPQWLILTSSRNNESPGVLSTRLRDINVQDYEKTDLYKLIQDTGLEISGLRMGPDEIGSVFIGLGPEPAAHKFRSMLGEALAKS